VVYRVEICRAFQHTSKYQRERPAVTRQEDSVSKWTGESSGFSQQVDWRIKRIQSASGLANQVGSIDKWIGERQSSVQSASGPVNSVQSTSGSVDTKKAQSRGNQEGVQSAIGSVDTKNSSIDNRIS
jgi:hypothetical protein